MKKAKKFFATFSAYLCKEVPDLGHFSNIYFFVDLVYILSNQTYEQLVQASISSKSMARFQTLTSVISPECTEQ